MNRFKLCFVGLICVLQMYSCRDNCPPIEGVEVTGLLYLAAKNNSYDYCNLAYESVNGNEDALRMLCLLRIGDAAGYDHGAVIVDIINKVGTTKFIDALRGINKEEKELVKSYLAAGLEYGGEYSDFSTLEQVFPEIAVFLDK